MSVTVFMPEIVVRGNAIFVEYRVADRVPIPPQPLDPDGGVTFSLWDPEGTVVVDAQVMTKAAVGIYRYTHQLLVTDPVGAWTAQAVATHQSKLSRSRRETIMVVESELGSGSAP